MADKTILVVVDPTSAEQTAVDRAAELAVSLSADLELFICDYDPDIAAGLVSTVYIDKPAREHLMSILEKKLERLAGPLRGRDLNVKIDVAWDHPLHDGIVRKVLATNPWMVVKDTHHHNVLKRTILSNTDWSLIRDCPAPLLLVKLEPEAAPAKICAAVDPMHEHAKPAQLDEKIYELAKILADGTGAELHMVHTYAAAAELAAAEGIPFAEISKEVQSEHQKAFDAFLAEHPVPAANAHLLEGLAHEQLAEFTEKKGVGVIVMGAVSRSGLGRIFIGSTAERVLDRLTCDLLIVKPEGFQSSVSRAD